MGAIKHATACPHLGNKPTPLTPRARHTHTALPKAPRTHGTEGAAPARGLLSPLSAEADLEIWLCGQPQALSASEGLPTQESLRDRLQFRYGTAGTDKAIIRVLPSLYASKPR